MIMIWYFYMLRSHPKRFTLKSAIADSLVQRTGNIVLSINDNLVFSLQGTK